ncbi:hypothetical protein R1sor_009014 [Riccia sorocarpa]|uniref:Uncharacterized protein n=1 Tax=Riccia sorocarpa TaxID=122646 RepID=A0ABD3H7U6_9MARC
MTSRTATRLGLADLQPYKKLLRMADQSRKLPLGELRGVETVMGGAKFNLDYIVLQPEDEQGYEILIGRPWFYGAGVIEDWNRKEVCFRVEGQKKKVRITWGPIEYHVELVPPEEIEIDAPGSCSEPSQFQDNDTCNSMGSSTFVDAHDFITMSGYSLEVDEGSDAELYAYIEEIKALYMSGLEFAASDTGEVQHKEADVYGLHDQTKKLPEGIPLAAETSCAVELFQTAKEPGVASLKREPQQQDMKKLTMVLTPTAVQGSKEAKKVLEKEKSTDLRGVRKKNGGVPSRKEGNLLDVGVCERSNKTRSVGQLPTKRVVRYAANSASEERRHVLHSEKGGDTICQKQSDILTAPTPNGRTIDSEGETISARTITRTSIFSNLPIFLSQPS